MSKLGGGGGCAGSGLRNFYTWVKQTFNEIHFELVSQDKLAFTVHSAFSFQSSSLILSGCIPYNNSVSWISFFFPILRSAVGWLRLRDTISSSWKERIFCHCHSPSSDLQTWLLLLLNCICLWKVFGNYPLVQNRAARLLVGCEQWACVNLSI